VQTVSIRHEADPKIPEPGELRCLTNVEAPNLQNVSALLVIVVGEPIGTRFAQLFSHFGTDVCLLQRGDRILSGRGN
jgi:pyruvate/2-oxoglutarate dehydrogenase complex dihydrolipoamide dehydrogenase (E3) component